MICLICRQAEIVASLTSVTFLRGEMHLTVNHVPARVCPSCSEAYVDKDVAVQLLQSAENIFEAGILEDTIDYQAGSQE